MSHKPCGIFKTYEEYISEETNPEMEETITNDPDFIQHEMKEKDCGAR